MRAEFETKTTTINGRGYQVIMLPYSQGKSVLLRLYKIFGPTLSEALAKIPQGAPLGDTAIEKFAPALSGVFAGLAQHLSEPDLDYLVNIFGEVTSFENNGKWPKLSKENREFLFAGNYGELFQWLGFCIRVNFLGFTEGQAWSEMLRKAEALLKAMQPPSQSPSTLTGQPIGSQAPSATASN